ncbi:hypothetical protein VE00_03481 [Pseudogymnoascus sp. WSF 3629]|nr:hypothetical protein VE00_03481 [Pseudogymnoascus sp. WSF 3629]
MELGGAMWWESSADALGSKSLIRSVYLALSGQDGLGLERTPNRLAYPDSIYANLQAGMPDSESASESTFASSATSSLSARSSSTTTSTVTLTTTMTTSTVTVTLTTGTGILTTTNTTPSQCTFSSVTVFGMMTKNSALAGFRLWPKQEVLRIEALSDQDVLSELEGIMAGRSALEFTFEDGDVIFEWNILCDEKRNWEQTKTLSSSSTEFNRDRLINLKILPTKAGFGFEGSRLVVANLDEPNLLTKDLWVASEEWEAHAFKCFQAKPEKTSVGEEDDDDKEDDDEEDDDEEDDDEDEDYEEFEESDSDDFDENEYFDSLYEMF